MSDLLAEVTTSVFGGRTDAMLAVLAEVTTSVAIARIVSDVGARGTLRSPAPLTRAAIAIVVLQAVFMARSWAPRRVPLSLPLRLALLTGVHLCALAVECRFTIEHFDWRVFGRCLGRSLAYVAPAYPLLVLAGSTLLLVATAAAESTVGAHHLRWLVDLGSLHSPFWFVYAHTKANARARCSSRVSLLPLARHSAAPAAGAAAERRRLRSW